LISCKGSREEGEEGKGKGEGEGGEELFELYNNYMLRNSQTSLENRRGEKRMRKEGRKGKEDGRLLERSFSWACQHEINDCSR